MQQPSSRSHGGARSPAQSLPADGGGLLHGCAKLARSLAPKVLGFAADRGGFAGRIAVNRVGFARRIAADGSGVLFCPLHNGSSIDSGCAPDLLGSVVGSRTDGSSVTLSRRTNDLSLAVGGGADGLSVAVGGSADALCVGGGGRAAGIGVAIRSRTNCIGITLGRRTSGQGVAGGGRTYSVGVAVGGSGDGISNRQFVDLEWRLREPLDNTPTQQPIFSNGASKNPKRIVE